MPKPVVDVRADTEIAVVCEPPRRLPVPLIPTRHMMNQYNPRERPRAQGTRKVGVDNIPIMSLNHHSLSKHALIHVSLVAIHNPGSHLTLVKKSRPAEASPEFQAAKKGPKPQSVNRFFEREIGTCGPRRGKLFQNFLSGQPEPILFLQNNSLEGTEFPTRSASK